MSDLGSSNWSETDASNNAAVPNGWPEGMNPSDVNNAARANMGAVKRFWDRANSVKTTTGTTTAYVLTYDVAASALYDGEEFSFIVNATCGATPTLNINGLGAKSLRKFTAGAYAVLAASDILANQPIRVRYNLGATTFDIVSAAVAGSDLATIAGNNAFTGTNTFVGGGIVPTGAMLPFFGRAAPSGWLLCNGAAVSRVTYAALFAQLVKSSVVTITIATPGVVAWTAHGLWEGDTWKASTTGALPTGLTAGTTYYVKAVDADHFQLSATPGGAAINTSGSQSGVHTAVSAPAGDGDGSTTFNTPDWRGRTIIGHDASGTSVAGRITFAASGVYGIALGYAGGEQAHTLTKAETPAPTVDDLVNISGGTAIEASTSSAPSTPLYHGVSGYGGGAHNNVQPAIVFPMIIRT